MKLIKKETVNDFAPFSFTLMVETKKEADVLLSIFNASYDGLSEFVSNNHPNNKQFNSDDVRSVSECGVFELIKEKL